MSFELSQDQICSLIKKSKTIAVVGFSSNPDRISHQIALMLSEEGYNVVGVNPFCEKSVDIPVYADLESIPIKVDIVNVFRRPETINELIPSVIKINPGALWLQEGIRNDDAVLPLREYGISVIQDKCIAVYYRKCRQST